MKKTKVTVLRCSLCGQEHPGGQVKHGWHAIYKTDKRVKTERLHCPDCRLDRLGIKRS